MTPPPATTTSPSPSSSSSSTHAAGGGGGQAPSWWESVSQARTRILALAAAIPSADASIAVLADSERPAHSLLHSAAAYSALAAALSSPTSGGGGDPVCHWLYDTVLSPDPDLRLTALSLLPVLSSSYLLRLPSSPSSLSGLEAVLLAVYSFESKSRGGKPLLVSLPDLSLPSLYHSPPPPNPHTRSPRSQAPPPLAAPAPPAIGVLSPPLEPQVAVKSTKRAAIIGVGFEAYYSKIALMPACSKVDLCDAAAAWAGQYCPCRFELDEEEEGNEIGSLSPTSSSSSASLMAAAEEMGRLQIGNGRHCNGVEEEEVGRKEARVLLPWELLQPLLRILGHCLLAPLNPKEVRDAASIAVRVVYARACHELMPQAILAARSLIQLDKSARKAAKAAAGVMVAVGAPGSTESSSKPSSKPNTPSKQKKPDVLLASK